jgi:hypothetical protein
MKLKYVLYVVLAVSVVFVAVMGYLFYSQRQGASSTALRGGSSGSESSGISSNIKSSPPVSKKGGSLVIAYSGDIAGRVDPCPCTQPAMGGFARRATVLRDYKRTVPGKPFLLLETGSEFNQVDDLADPTNLIVISAMKHLGIHAVNAIPGDLRRLIALQGQGKFQATGQPEFISSQLEAAPGKQLPIKPYVVQTLRLESENRDLRIGVLALSKSALDNPDLGRLMTDDQAIGKWLPEVEPQSDLVVLLTRMKPDEVSAVARKYPSIDVVINGDPVSEGREFGRVGNTVLVEAAHLGIAIGILELDWDANGKITKSSNQFIPLPPNVTPDPAVAQVVQKGKKEVVAYKESNSRKLPSTALISDFAGASDCKKCHEKAYAVWQKSAHSRSLESLKTEGNQFNNDCLICHVTAFGADRGYIDYIRTPDLSVVTCVACHNFATEHARNPKAPKTSPGPGSYKTKVTERRCKRCHNSEQSPSFNFDKELKRIAH